MRDHTVHKEQCTTPVTRVARWLWSAVVSPPRRDDRIEAVAAVVLSVLLLAAVPVAAAVGTEVHSAWAARAAAESATRTPATATLLADTPAPIVTSEGVVDPHTTSRPARWTTRDGTTRVGPIEVVDGAVRGQAVAIWLDPAGDPVPSPTTPGEAAVVGVATALGIVVAAGLLALCSFTAVRGLLHRRRARVWTAEWARVGPRWTRRTH